ncbi:uncharacterized protein LOC111281629 isoform X2 [Durio zibethinus]|uniref:Uncharacterized protein LOC111281629 isoform X2 n=1 Tax=Durio zibethinus TaxID=66656 RepID=A0A6P5X9J2_DURZI|nr:uncharacterized protein LOC111281629 isoform X2 [Durio zibethinus]
MALDRRIIFFPLWMFHGVVAGGRFSLPAPSVPHNRQWAPCHAIVAIPLLIAFELLLCIYLESVNVHGVAAINLKTVFLPLLAFEILILIDNISNKCKWSLRCLRMCRALMPGDDESISDETIWETLPHFWVAISMVFFVAATVFTPLKLCGDFGALGWWVLFINFGTAESFAFLVCTKWSNPVIHRESPVLESGSPSTTIGYIDWNSGLAGMPEEDQHLDTTCSLQEVGGHIMKIPIIGFQVLLCMHLEGTPPGARHIPLPILFSPLFLLQGAGVLFAASTLIEKIVLLQRCGAGTGLYLRISSRAHDCLGFLHHGSRLLGWWSIDEGSQEEQAQLYHDGASGYGGFRQLLVSKQKSQTLVSRSLRDFKMRKCYVGFALRERLVWFCFPVGIVFFAVPAARSVENAQFVVSPLRNAYLYTMFNFQVGNLSAKMVVHGKYQLT